MAAEKLTVRVDAYHCPNRSKSNMNLPPSVSVNVAVDAGLVPTCGLRQIRASVRLNRHSTTIFRHADRDNEELCLHESLAALNTDRN